METSERIIYEVFALSDTIGDSQQKKLIEQFNNTHDYKTKFIKEILKELDRINE